jgi:hypothetical protein
MQYPPRQALKDKPAGLDDNKKFNHVYELLGTYYSLWYAAFTQHKTPHLEKEAVCKCPMRSCISVWAEKKLLPPFLIPRPEIHTFSSYEMCLPTSLNSFKFFRAPAHSRIAHIATNSGVSIAYTIVTILLFRLAHFETHGPGTLG